MAGLLERGLEEEGHAVDVAGRGEDALWMARATRLRRDRARPDAPGSGRLRRVPRAARRRSVWTPVLLLTARDAVDDRVVGLDAGADDYLVKPFAFAELLARLRALMRARPDRASRRARASGDLRLDPAPHAHLARRAASSTSRRRSSPCSSSSCAARARRSRAAQLLERCLGHGLRAPLEHRRRLRRLPAREDRQAVRPALAGDSAPSRLSAA